MTRKPDKGEIRRDELAHLVMGGPSTDPHVHTDDELHGGAEQVHVTGFVVSVWRRVDPIAGREADGGKGIYQHDSQLQGPTLAHDMLANPAAYIHVASQVLLVDDQETYDRYKEELEELGKLVALNVPLTHAQNNRLMDLAEALNAAPDRFKHPREGTPG